MSSSSAKPLRKIAFLLEDFPVGGPAQQLVDRFLLGYPAEGGWRLPGDERAVAVHVEGGGWNDNLQRRVDEFGLVRAASMAEALNDADGVVVVPKGAGAAANEEVLNRLLTGVRPGCPVFAYGILANSLNSGQRLLSRAEIRGCPLCAGTFWPFTWRMPPLELPNDTVLTNALIVVQGGFPLAEFEAIEALLPLVEQRMGGETGINRIHRFESDRLFPMGQGGRWPGHLLAPALSRSHSPQGDPVRDGRTQDLAGLGLVEKLARSPRGWMIEHRDGLRSVILVLDGVVADVNAALETAGGEVFSTRVHRPPKPAEEAFSQQALALERYFTTGRRPAHPGRGLFEALALENLLRMSLYGVQVSSLSGIRNGPRYHPLP